MEGWQLTFAATAYNLVRLRNAGGEVSLIAGRSGVRWPPRRDSVSPCAPLSLEGGVTRMMAMKTARFSGSSRSRLTLSANTFCSL